MRQQPTSHYKSDTFSNYASTGLHISEKSPKPLVHCVFIISLVWGGGLEKGEGEAKFSTFTYVQEIDAIEL